MPRDIPWCSAKLPPKYEKDHVARDRLKVILNIDFTRCELCSRRFLTMILCCTWIAIRRKSRNVPRRSAIGKFPRAQNYLDGFVSYASIYKLRNRYLQRWMIPVPEDGNNEFDTEKGRAAVMRVWCTVAHTFESIEYFENFRSTYAGQKSLLRAPSQSPRTRLETSRFLDEVWFC